MTLGCVDRELRAPRHYHHPSDTAENVDLEEFAASLESIEKFVDALVTESSEYHFPYQSGLRRFEK